MAIVVEPVNTSRARRQFLALPDEIYRHTPQWVPPLRQMERELLGLAPHPFYKRGKSQLFLATDNGKPVGRVMAIDNAIANEYHHERRGYIGFFESVDDTAVSRPLFDAAKVWLTGRDLHDIRGPVNPTTNYSCGLLVDGFEHSPTFLMTYNLPYYERLWLDYGFAKSQELYAFMGHWEQLAKLDPKLLRVMEGSKERFGVTVRPCDKERFSADIAMFLDLFNKSMSNMWGFVPLSAEEIARMSKEMKMLIKPNLALIAEVDGKPIGAVFGMPDYNPRIKKMNGKLFPFGWWTLLYGQPFKRFRAVSTNVLPEYQMWGIGLVLLAGLIPAVKDSGITEGEFSWVAESNHLSRASLEKGGALREKTYRIYDLPRG